MGVEMVQELLTCANFESWRRWMITYLKGEGLWEIVQIPNPNNDDYIQKNAKALHAMYVSCGPEAFPIIIRHDTAKGAWEAIYKAFGESERPSPVDAQRPSTSGTRNDNNIWRRQLYETVVNGDWLSMEGLIDKHPEALSNKLSYSQTVLHTAVLHDHVHLVDILLEKMSLEQTELTLQNRDNSTALHLAAGHGNVTIAEALVNQNPKLLDISDASNRLPVDIASLLGNVAMVQYLRSVTPIKGRQVGTGIRDILINAILAENYEAALMMYSKHDQSLFAENKDGLTPLKALATKSFVDQSENQLKFWQKWSYNAPGSSEQMEQKRIAQSKLLKSMIDRSILNGSIGEKYVLNALESASRFGNVEFVVSMEKYEPTLVKKANRIHLGSILRITIECRQERIWDLDFIYHLGKKWFEFDPIGELFEGNSLLHAAAKQAPSIQLNKVSGPTMQMQRELQWFKEVETIVPTLLKEGRNKEGKTARELFTEEHKELVKEAEKWMRETSRSCMVVATLIATVMFAAAFTVPGGYDDQKGIPIFLPQASFLVFIIADALSLFSSIASILMFLSILTSRFAEEDFLESLPKKLIIGLATLFSSIATMMVAYSAALVIVLHDRYKWVVSPIALFASVPVTLFALLQLPLFVDMVLSTYGPSIFRKQTKMVPDSGPAQPVHTNLLSDRTDSNRRGLIRRASNRRDQTELVIQL